MKILFKINKLTVVVAIVTTLIACSSTIALPPETLPGKWLVKEINENNILENSTVQLTFHKDKTLTGSASCNLISSTYKIENNSLSISPMATTRKMCLPALMDQEFLLVNTLSKVKRFQLHNGQLSLYDQKGVLQIKASRQKP